MCHLVSWFTVPRSDAQRNLMQTEAFVDEDERTGHEAARDFAEKQVRAGALTVRVWQLVDEARLDSVIVWTKANGERTE